MGENTGLRCSMHRHWNAASCAALGVPSDTDKGHTDWARPVSSLISIASTIDRPYLFYFFAFIHSLRLWNAIIPYRIFRLTYTPTAVPAAPSSFLPFLCGKGKVKKSRGLHTHTHTHINYGVIIWYRWSFLFSFFDAYIFFLSRVCACCFLPICNGLRRLWLHILCA